MTRTRPVPSRLTRVVARSAPGIVMVLLAAGCATGNAASFDPQSESDQTAITIDADTGDAIDDDDLAIETGADTSTGGIDLGAVGSLASSEVHAIDISFDDDDFLAMLETYAATGDKDWLEATVTIDGTSYERVGIRLKGNSSLRGVSVDVDPATLPWLIRLDKFVDDRHHDGLVEFVVRSNSTTTSLNEAVALELIELAGLASQDAIAVAFSVDGDDPVLRLVIDHPDDVWMEEALDESGALFKAQSSGDYSYRGDDPDAYDDVFSQKAGDDNADLTPLIEFLDFINNADDSTFTSELDEWLDVDAFATYLAIQTLIDNFDDIDGPGNNSYLFYDTQSDRFTVVAWDHNLAFGQRPGTGRSEVPGGAAPGGALGDRPGRSAGGEVTDGREPTGQNERGPGFGGGASRSNVLVTRFLANGDWSQLVDDRLAELRSALYDSGLADAVVDQWVATIASADLVDPTTIEAEAASIRAAFS